ncbi:Zinc finger protein 1 [Folsomia candida]|uniref:Zinc finger protein 1 n=1 Tax=Folsomia candida TaxID=158441 RepID=A0A226CY79_FOLCA|nr:Zinc finger protein 1 [Folsomia candida]
MDIKQDKSFKCAHCEKGFTTKKYLKYHTEAHDDNAQVNCEICGKTLKNPAVLKTHRRYMHGPRRKYLCEICTHDFGSSSNLLDHMGRIHQKGSRYACTFLECGKSFFAQREVDRHLSRVHVLTSQRERHPCTFSSCGKTFLSKNYIPQHIRVGLGGGTSALGGIKIRSETTGLRQRGALSQTLLTTSHPESVTTPILGQGAGLRNEQFSFRWSVRGP